MAQAPPIVRLPDGETRLIPFAEAKEMQNYTPMCDGWLLLGVRSLGQLTSKLREMQDKDGAGLLVALYCEAPNDAEVQLASAITGKREVLLRYTVN